MVNLALAQAKVRARVALFQSTPVRVVRGAAGVLDSNNILTGMTGATDIWTGPAHVKTITGEGTVSVGDGEFDTRQVQISIAFDAPPVYRDDLVIIVTSDEPGLTGAVFRVNEVNGGGVFNDARRLQCVQWHPSAIWGEQ